MSLVAEMDQTVIDDGIPKQVVFTPVKDGIYQIDSALVCVSPGTEPTIVQATFNYQDPALPDIGGIPVSSQLYTLTLDGRFSNNRQVDCRLLALKGGIPFLVTVVVLVRTGSITYRFLLNVVKMS